MRLRAFVLLFCFFVSGLLESASAQKQAPEIPQALAWVNTSTPHSLREYRGRFVLLDFWTLGCINCIHILPDLKRLEEEFATSLVVLGIHSGKFKSERVSSQIKLASERYGISHPVLNDERYEMWSAYGVRVWPTVVLIDPKGDILFQRSGEGVYESVAPVLRKAIEEAKGAGTLVSQRDSLITPTPASTVVSDPAQLRFPTKIAADAATGHLALSDTGNNRVVIVDSSGMLVEVIGGEGSGFVDGDFRTAKFSEPQGLVFQGDSIYLADRGNHAIRKIDRKDKSVSTLFGNGEQRTPGSSDTRATSSLSSPWDVAVKDNMLFVAMAGTHQIWRADLKQRRIAPVAGTGAEGLQDGPALESLLAQPSGLSLLGEKLYFADSESSSIRVFGSGGVKTLLGKGLFDFGDQDGPVGSAKLQHPLAVLATERTVYIVDTYNSKVKALSLTDGSVQTIVGGSNSPIVLNEPSGIAQLNATLYIVDTNHHAIVTYNLVTKVAGELKLRTAEPAQSAKAPRGERELKPMEIMLPSKGGELSVNVRLPQGFSLAVDAPSSLTVELRTLTPDATPSPAVDLELQAPLVDKRVSLDSLPQRGTIALQGAIYFCEKSKSLCHIDRFYQELNFSRASKASSAPLPLTLDVPAPAPQ